MLSPFVRGAATVRKMNGDVVPFTASTPTQYSSGRWLGPCAKRPVQGIRGCAPTSRFASTAMWPVVFMAVR
jgi:hypothetical protein